MLVCIDVGGPLLFLHRPNTTTGFINHVSNEFKSITLLKDFFFLFHNLPIFKHNSVIWDPSTAAVHNTIEFKANFFNTPQRILYILYFSFKWLLSLHLSYVSYPNKILILLILDPQQIKHSQFKFITIIILITLNYNTSHYSFQCHMSVYLFFWPFPCSFICNKLFSWLSNYPTRTHWKYQFLFFIIAILVFVNYK